MSNSTKHNPQQDMSNIKSRINVILWHILVAKIFVGWDFEEYYVNFYKDWKFLLEDFLKCINYMDKIFSWDNYNYRYELFDWKSDEILSFIEKDEIPRSLVDSMRYDMAYIIWKIEWWEIVAYPWDGYFLYNKEWVITVKKWIKKYLSLELNKLRQLIWSPEISQIRSELIKRLQKAKILS